GPGQGLPWTLRERALDVNAGGPDPGTARGYSTPAFFNAAANRASSQIAIPRVFAFASLEPASSPAITASVFLLTDDATFPPACSIRRVASSRGIDNVPVRTNVFPAKGPVDGVSRRS